MPGLSVESGELSIASEYTATETALVEWVDGNPYSKAADPDIVMRCRGGDNGRGRHSMSLMYPLKKTPDARVCTILSRQQPVSQIPLSQLFLVHPIYSNYFPRLTYARPRVVYPLQKRIGKNTIKKV